MLSYPDFNKTQRLALFSLFLSFILSVHTILFGHMNNWLIFKNSFFHLLNGTNLYKLYPNEATDIFVYSPSFALVMAPLSILPDSIGAILWNLIGAILLLSAILKLPLEDTQKRAIIWISLPEFIGSTQNFQSNIHITALILWFWINIENQRPFFSSLCILGGLFIKIFGVVLATSYLNLHYSVKNPKFLFKSLFFLTLGFVIIALAPLLVTSWDTLSMQYTEWFNILQWRSARTYGFSLMGIIHGLTGWKPNNLIFQIVGGLSLLASLAYHYRDNRQGRLLSLVSIMYFMILFNHGSESPTYIIVMVAFGIHQSMIANKKLRWFLIVFTLGCVSLLYSDPLRAWSPIFNQYAAKAWPLVLLYPMALLRVGVPKETTT